MLLQYIPFFGQVCYNTKHANYTKYILKYTVLSMSSISKPFTVQDTSWPHDSTRSHMYSEKACSLPVSKKFLSDLGMGQSHSKHLICPNLWTQMNHVYVYMILYDRIFLYVNMYHKCIMKINGDSTIYHIHPHTSFMYFDVRYGCPHTKAPRIWASTAKEAGR